MAKLMIPTPLRQYAGKKDSVEVEASTVAEALTKLTDEHGDLRRHLFNDEGKLRSFVNVYVNDEDIRYLEKDQTAIKSGDVISIVPSIAGGKPTATEAPPVTLSNDEILRYSRHLIMPEVGMEGQLKLKAAKVLMIGNLVEQQFLSARNWPFGATLAMLIMATVLVFLLIYVRAVVHRGAADQSVQV